jgi:hypothetical protein
VEHHFLLKSSESPGHRIGGTPNIWAGNSARAIHDDGVAALRFVNLAEWI